jgi:triphosphoribosyl-dephospho-CoA synthase
MTALLDRETIARAYRHACRLDVTTLKPGNVHVHAAGHRMQVEDFERSAEVTAPIISDPPLGVGDRIRRAVDATFDAVGCNTNLGILLLCAPIAAAAGQNLHGAKLSLRLDHVLTHLDEADAEQVFRAIARANPAGLGEAPEGDVHRRPPPGMTLMRAMELAAGRDLIAAEYRDRFQGHLPGWLEDYERRVRAGSSETEALSAVFLRALATVPDTHIARKHGPASAECVRNWAAEVLERLTGDESQASTFHALMSFDMALKGDGLNPGALADLMVATAFLALLRTKIAEFNL